MKQATRTRQSASSQRQKEKGKARRKPKPRKKSPPATIEYSDQLTFPEVKGKSIEELKLYLSADDTSLSILFADKTLLHFDLEPRITVRADLSDWKTHNWRRIKRWLPLTTETAWED